VLSLVGILVLSFFLGMRHATDPDHVVAITTIVTKQRGVAKAGGPAFVVHRLPFHRRPSLVTSPFAMSAQQRPKGPAARVHLHQGHCNSP